LATIVLFKAISIKRFAKNAKNIARRNEREASTNEASSSPIQNGLQAFFWNLPLPFWMKVNFIAFWRPLEPSRCINGFSLVEGSKGAADHLVHLTWLLVGIYFSGQRLKMLGSALVTLALTKCQRISSWLAAAKTELRKKPEKLNQFKFRCILFGAGVGGFIWAVACRRVFLLQPY